MFVEVAVLLLLLLVYLFVMDRKPRNMPPGPLGIPFVRGLPIFDEHKIEALRAKYGSIFTVGTGRRRSVFICDYKMGKDALSDMELLARPDFLQNVSVNRENPIGFFAGRGPQWKHDRLFVIKVLQKLGIEEDRLEESVKFEAKALVTTLSALEGQAINNPFAFRTAALNVMWQLVANRRYDLQSKEVETIYKANVKIHSLGQYAFLGTLFPVLRKLPRFLRNLILKEDLFADYSQKMMAVILETIREHEKHLNLDNPRDLIEAYMKEMKNQESEDDNVGFRLDALVQIVGDIFIAGSNTVNDSLKWIVFLLARYPHVRAKLQKELDDFLPRDHVISFHDKTSFPYLEAFVVETLRFSNLTVLVMREAMNDTTIAGFFIPQKTLVNVSLYHSHRDTRYWEDPLKFNPDRLIDEEGKFQTPKEGLIAFGAGRRQCIAENLAKRELFHFSAALAQNFDIEFADPSNIDDRVIYVDQIGTRLPIDHKLKYIPRPI